ncbi:MAG: amidohydrolase family protein [Deinococcota bacterium]
MADPSAHADGVIQDGAVVFKPSDETQQGSGRVIAAGAWQDLQADYGHLTPLFVPTNKLVIPGLVNAHHHGRGLDTRQVGMVDKPLELWLVSFLLYPQLDAYLDTQLAAARMLQQGITTSLVAHSHPGPLEAYKDNIQRSLEAYLDVGMRIAFAPGHYDQHVLVYEPEQVFFRCLPNDLAAQAADYFDPKNSYIQTDDYVDVLTSLSQVYKGHHQVRILANPIGLHWMSDGLLETTAELVTRGFGLHLHVLETTRQRAYAEQTFSKSAVQVLADYGLLGSKTSLAHGIWLSEADIELLADTNTTVITNPSSNQRLGSGRASVAAMLQAGVPLGLGTDSMSLIGQDDLLAEVTLLQGLHHLPEYEHATWPSSYQALELATCGGAVATTFEDVGKLLPGCHADITVLNVPRAVQEDIVSYCLGQVNATDVTDVFVGGQHRVRAGKLVGVDVDALEAKVWAQARFDEHTDKCAFLGRLEPHLKKFYEKF